MTRIEFQPGDVYPNNIRCGIQLSFLERVLLFLLRDPLHDSDGKVSFWKDSDGRWWRETE